jgi:DNA repair protein RecO (recombination protein O)
MAYLKIKGIVTREVNFGETDKILTVLTGEHGLISVFVKGARKGKSGNAASASLLCYSEFTLYKGKTMYSANDINICESFYEIRNDIDAFFYACYFAEIVNAIAQEEDESEDLLKLLLNSLYYLTRKNKKLIKSIFEMRSMMYTGVAPCVNVCVLCGKAFADENEASAFSYEHAGIICYDCNCSKQDLNNDVKIMPATALALRHIVFSNEEGLFSFGVSETVQKELSAITEEYVRVCTDKKFKSLNVIF